LTIAGSSDHNPPIVHVIRAFRTLIALLTVALAAADALLPQLHAHVTRDAEGRLHTVVHQHWAAHHVGAARGPALDDEETATYFSQSTVASSSFTQCAPALAVAIRLGRHGVVRLVARPIESAAWPHGPPRAAASLRAPPRTA
jgi:hypothetical protein